eukprot:jgi/Mesen1/2288/ME000154S01454
MSKKRGLSLEEKRSEMLKIFHETEDFFLLKDLEKLGPRKGVISQSVKDVVQSLVDDDLVCRDKIGTSIYFWSLPSQAENQLRRAQAKLEQELVTLKERRGEVQKVLSESKKGREDSVSSYTAKKEENEELEQYAENDPEVLEAKKVASKVAREAANRWTDNIFTMQSWCNENFPGAKENLQGLYNEVGITEDMDYIEL